jgi:HEAT repeat protein
MTEQVEPENTEVPDSDSIAALVDALTCVDGVERQTARGQLAKIGQPAVPFLIEALQSPSDHARWEAAKALGTIADPAAAPALVQTLQDEKSAVRWLAATALINLGHAALAPLLRGLESNAD